MLAEQLSPGFREDFGRAAIEGNAVGVKDLAVTGVQLSPTYRLVDPAGQDRKAAQMRDTAYRAEAGAAEHPGRWLGEQPARTKGGAESLYNVEKWGNPLEVMREYRLRHDLTVYEGGVEGGTGRQAYVPPDIPKEHLDELLRRSGEWELP